MIAIIPSAWNGVCTVPADATDGTATSESANATSATSDRAGTARRLITASRWKNAPKSTHFVASLSNATRVAPPARVHIRERHDSGRVGTTEPDSRDAPLAPAGQRYGCCEQPV